MIFSRQPSIFLYLGDDKEKEDTLNGLEKAKGFIRSEIGQRIRLRKTPEITLNSMNRLSMVIK